MVLMDALQSFRNNAGIRELSKIIVNSMIKYFAESTKYRN